MRNAAILSCGMYVPEQRLPNAYFDKLLGEDVSTWLEENLTIRQRFWSAENESTADLCENAARKTLAAAGISAEQLDLLIIATDTPEYISPSTAAVVQDRLGAKNAGTFDLNSACAGFVTALDIAAKYIIADDKYNHVLVIGGYAMSKYLDLTDKKTVTIFADGAGAFLLGATENPERGFLTSDLKSKGQYHDWMGVYGGGTKFPLTADRLAHKDHLLKFVKKFPKELNPEMWSTMIRDMATRLHISPANVDHFFITQININSIFETLDLLDIPRERAHTVMDRYGYTGSACIPMAFCDAIESGKIKHGDLLFFVGSGGGLAFASAAFPK